MSKRTAGCHKDLTSVKLKGEKRRLGKKSLRYQCSSERSPTTLTVCFQAKIIHEWAFCDDGQLRPATSTTAMCNHLSRDYSGSEWPHLKWCGQSPKCCNLRLLTNSAPYARYLLKRVLCVASCWSPPCLCPIDKGGDAMRYQRSVRASEGTQGVTAQE